jgi:hypothetical protein
MNALNDKNGKTISKGIYVKYFENNLWEVFDWDADYNMIWLEPRAGNLFPAQWAYGTEIEVTDLQQLHLDI